MPQCDGWAQRVCPQGQLAVTWLMPRPGPATSQPRGVLRATWPPPAHKTKPSCVAASHLQPASVEEELEEGRERDVHVQVPLLPWLQRLQELPPDEAEGEEGVDSDGDHLPGAQISRRRGWQPRGMLGIGAARMQEAQPVTDALVGLRLNPTAPPPGVLHIPVGL